METACEVAKQSCYRKHYKAWGVSREGSATSVYDFVLMWVWLVLRPGPDEGSCCSACMDTLPTPIQPLHYSLIPACFIPSIHLCFCKWTPRMLEWELRCGRGKQSWTQWPVSGHVATECIRACKCVFVFLLGDALSSALLHSDSGR